MISITFLAAALSARAQLTPDGIMALLPNMPTQAEMIRYAKESCAPVSVHVEVTQPTLYDDFREALQAALEKASGSTDQNLEPSMNKKINGGKVAGTNRTESELAHMTESQREAYARSQAASQLSGMGLSAADIAKLQSGNVSRAEAEALARTCTTILTRKRLISGSLSVLRQCVRAQVGKNMTPPMRGK